MRSGTKLRFLAVPSGGSGSRCTFAKVFSHPFLFHFPRTGTLFHGASTFCTFRDISFSFLCRSNTVTVFPVRSLEEKATLGYIGSTLARRKRRFQVSNAAQSVNKVTTEKRRDTPTGPNSVNKIWKQAFSRRKGKEA